MVNCRKMNKKDETQYSMNNTIHNIQFKTDVYNKHDIQHYKPIQDYLTEKKNTPTCHVTDHVKIIPSKLLTQY